VAGRDTGFEPGLGKIAFRGVVEGGVVKEVVVKGLGTSSKSSISSKLGSSLFMNSSKFEGFSSFPCTSLLITGGRVEEGGSLTS
jgi:hypothetical protein